MELFIALVLFISLIACWLVLPGEANQRVARREADAVSHVTMEQLA